ncbi:hypothetical protein Scep_026260 [Stephania cephalantha]|uniref:XPG-I domain-containing protein n=1 Tax=Stephania cephalantha TaxID=152367 RepID=A0AAP0EJT0_9MAGN
MLEPFAPLASANIETLIQMMRAMHDDYFHRMSEHDGQSHVSTIPELQRSQFCEAQQYKRRVDSKVLSLGYLTTMQEDSHKWKLTISIDSTLSRPVKRYQELRELVSSTRCAVELRHATHEVSVERGNQGIDGGMMITRTANSISTNDDVEIGTMNSPFDKMFHGPYKQGHTSLLQHNEDCKILLRLKEVSVIEAPSKAEAECTTLYKSGVVYVVASEDMDSLTFGTPRFIHHLIDPS